MPRGTESKMSKLCQRRNSVDIEKVKMASLGIKTMTPLQHFKISQRKDLKLKAAWLHTLKQRLLHSPLGNDLLGNLEVLITRYRQGHCCTFASKMGDVPLASLSLTHVHYVSPFSF